MARNEVQFQKGLSMAEFHRLYGTEEQCHAALVRMRWRDGFVCPRCAGRSHGYCAPKRLFQCTACRLQTSTRAGTIFHKSRTPLTKWFLAMHLMTASKNDIAALELARQLDVKWDTAWLIKQKLMEAMRQRNSIYRLAGDIQIDGSGRPEGSDFKWVNTGLGNVKSAITGTLRSCDPQHAPRYLAAFEWRYNRRFELRENLGRLARVAAAIKPQPRQSIIAIRPKSADQSG